MSAPGNPAGQVISTIRGVLSVCWCVKTTLCNLEKEKKKCPVYLTIEQIPSSQTVALKEMLRAVLKKGERHVKKVAERSGLPLQGLLCLEPRTVYDSRLLIVLFTVL